MSRQRPPKLLALLDGLPHYLLLEDAAGVLYALVPASFAFSPALSSEPFGARVALDRTHDQWSTAVGAARHYLYRAHHSHGFLFTPSLASRLYLLLLFFQVPCSAQQATAHQMMCRDDLDPTVSAVIRLHRWGS